MQYNTVHLLFTDAMDCIGILWRANDGKWWRESWWSSR